MNKITNPPAALIVAQRINEGRGLSGFTPQEIAAGTALHERQTEIRALYFRVIGEDDAPPLPPITDGVRRVLEAEEKAMREGLDLLMVLPPETTREDLNTAAAVRTMQGNGFRRETDDMHEIAEAVRPFFHGKTTLQEAFAQWEVSQRPEETPITFFDADTDRRLTSIIVRAFEVGTHEPGSDEARRIVMEHVDTLTKGLSGDNRSI